MADFYIPEQVINKNRISNEHIIFTKTNYVNYGIQNSNSLDIVNGWFQSICSDNIINVKDRYITIEGHAQAQNYTNYTIKYTGLIKVNMYIHGAIEARTGYNLLFNLYKKENNELIHSIEEPYGAVHTERQWIYIGTLEPNTEYDFNFNYNTEIHIDECYLEPITISERIKNSISETILNNELFQKYCIPIEEE